MSKGTKILLGCLAVLIVAFVVWWVAAGPYMGEGP
jgi:hypothetical protein